MKKGEEITVKRRLHPGDAPKDITMIRKEFCQKIRDLVRESHQEGWDNNDYERKESAIRDYEPSEPRCWAESNVRKDLEEFEKEMRDVKIEEEMA